MLEQLQLLVGGFAPASALNRAHSHIIRLVLLIGACTASTVHAVDLGAVYDMARANDPVIGAARASYDARRQVVPQARSSLLPSITAQGTSDWNERNFQGEAFDLNPTSPTFGDDLSIQNFNTHGYSARLRQSILNLANWHNYQSSKAIAKGAQWILASSEQDLLVRVATAYLNVLRAQDLLDSTLAQEAAVKRQLEQVQQRFDVGLVAITDVLESTAVYDNAVVNRIQADGDHDNFFNTLTTLTGESFDELSRLSEQLPVVSPAPASVDDWVQDALDNNYSVLAARENVVATRKTLRARRADHLPTIDATISTIHNVDASPSFFGDGFKLNQDIYAIELNLPIYQGGFTTSRAKEAKALFRQATMELEDAERSVVRDVRNLYRSVTTDVVRVKARLKAIQSSESALEATQTGYEVGTRNIVDVLQAQQRLYGAQFDYADSRYNYVLNMLRLKAVAGSLSAEDLADINRFMDSANAVRRLASLRARTMPQVIGQLNEAG